MKKYTYKIFTIFGLLHFFTGSISAQNQAVELEIRAKAGLQFNVVRFAAKPGQSVNLNVFNDDEMAHNLVFTKIGQRVAVANAALNLGEKAEEKNWIPDLDSVLWSTPVLKPGDNHELKFTAPKEKGIYPYVCTFIGHGFVMYGAMYVDTPMPDISTDQNVPEIARTGGSSTGSDPKIGKGKIENFTYTAYKGSWDKMPDFSKLKPHKSGKASSGIADPGLAGLSENFGLVFEGEINISEKGTYDFSLGSDDGSRLYINDKLVVDNDGVHSMTTKKGKIKLDSGKAKLKLEYFEKGGQEELALEMSGPNVKRLQLAKQVIKPKKAAFPSGNPIEITSETRIYRNFIEGASPRGIGVGYPEKVNLCFDANTMQIAMLWHGAFMDGAKHWNGRGQGFQRPSGHYLMNINRDQPFAQLKSNDAPWPKAEGRDTRAKNFRFRGYFLDGKERRPTFGYSFGDFSVTDYPSPQAGSMPFIIRNINIKGTGQTWYLAAAGKSITKQNDLYNIDNSMLQIGFSDLGSLKPEIRENSGRQELLIKLNVDGQVTLKQHYRWNVEYILKEHTHGHKN